MQGNRAFRCDAVDQLHRLQQLTSEIQIVAELLGNDVGQDVGARPSLNGKNIRQLIRARRARESCFEGEVLSDCAWDMLLDLMAARVDQESICVTSLCLASNAPQSTALRWIKRLLEGGIIERYGDRTDSRRSYLRLTDWAAAKIEGLLAFGHFGFW